MDLKLEPEPDQGPEPKPEPEPEPRIIPRQKEIIELESTDDTIIRDIKNNDNVESDIIKMKRPSIDEEMFYDVIRAVNVIKNKCTSYKTAHLYCHSFNQNADKFIKLMMLGLSTLTTYFINKHTSELEVEELTLDKNLTFATTIITGINAIFNFSNRAETHKAITMEYIKLQNEIELKLKTFNYQEGNKWADGAALENRLGINAIYEKAVTDITNLTIRSTEIGLLGRAKKKAKLTDHGIYMDEYRGDFKFS